MGMDEKAKEFAEHGGENYVSAGSPGRGLHPAIESWSSAGLA